MIDKYYNGVIENLEMIKRYQENDDSVFFTWHEFGYRELTGAYEPFLDTGCDMFRKYRDGDFDTFLTECGVYELHREVFRSYYENGICERAEMSLLSYLR